MSSHHDTVQTAFTAQAAGFNASPVQNQPEILGALVELAQPTADDHWLEAACGPGIVSRTLAPHVASVHGIDLTPAMVELARREAARVGLANATFAVGDATATALDAHRLDGAVNRSTLHHVPRPGRLLAEMARVVRPGGRVVIADHLADEDRDAFAWVQEVERIRDPSHWASLTAGQLRELGDPTGLTLIHERVIALQLDFDEWLNRGTTDPAVQALVEQLVAQRPDGTERFALDGRALTLQMWLGVWRVNDER